MSHLSNHRLFACLVGALAGGLDQSSKLWALAALRSAGSTLVLPGPVDLTLVFNRSSAFGLMPEASAVTRWGLASINLMVVAILVWTIMHRRMSVLNACGWALIAAGAGGNALDRFRFGMVIDFIDASKMGFVWVFNIADASIDLGIGLLLLGGLLGSSRAT